MVSFIRRDDSFNSYAEFSEKLTFITPLYAHVVMCAYHGVKNVSLSEKFANALNKRSLIPLILFISGNRGVGGI